MSDGRTFCGPRVPPKTLERALSILRQVFIGKELAVVQTCGRVQIKITVCWYYRRWQKRCVGVAARALFETTCRRRGRGRRENEDEGEPSLKFDRGL